MVELTSPHNAITASTPEDMGSFFDPAGIDVVSALRHFAEKKSLAGFAGAPAVTMGEILLLPCDILVPAALGGVITVDNASQIRAKVIVEGANGPTSPAADRNRLAGVM